MTREEAIQILADLIESPFLHTWEKQNKALHMAIEALSANPNCKECKRHNNTTFFMDYEDEPSVSAEQKERGDADIPKNQSIMQQSRHDDGKIEIEIIEEYDEELKELQKGEPNDK